MELTVNDWLFIAEYVKDWKPSSALRRAGFYSGKYVSEEAGRRLRKPAVKLEVERLRAELLKQSKLSATAVIDDIAAVLNADVRELYEIFHGACRHCHGEDHAYQMTHGEYKKAEYDAFFSGKPFKPRGEPTFNPYADPHPDCPECFGRGETRERIKDVRDLSPEAAKLYAGGEVTKNGLKIVMRSKDEARRAAALFLGMNKETVRVLDGGKDIKEATDEELEAIARGEKV